MGEPFDPHWPPPSLERWREQVRRDLGGRDPDSLRWRSPDGVELEPLYTSDAGAAERGLPGAPPFVRGSERAREWRIVHEPIGTDRTVILESARRAHAEGADGVWLTGEHDLAELGSLDAPVWIVAAGATMADAWLSRSEHAKLTVLADPLSTRAGGWLPTSIDDALVHLAEVVGRARASRPGARPILVSARVYAEGGASAVDELALLVASGVAYLRALSDAGQPLADLPRRMLFELALDADFFVGIAKLRAARWLWSKLLRTLGIDGPEQGMRVRAVSARRGTSVLDPHTNLVRGTAAAFAAVIGGAELVTVAPHDALSGAPSAHAERLARTTQLVLREEAQLGRVLDPAGGSYFLEALTDRLARGAWSALQEIEHLGGVARGLADGSIAERVRRGADERRRAIATRERGLVGVSRYPSPELCPAPPPSAAQPPAIEPYREAEPFEALRHRVAALSEEARRAIVIGVGDARGLGPRVDFARDVLEVAGLSVATAGVHAGGEDALAKLPQRLGVVAVCAADEAYGAVLAALSPTLRERGAIVVVAGRESDALRDLAGAFVHRGADLPRVLGAIVARLEEVS